MDSHMSLIQMFHKLSRYQESYNRLSDDDKLVYESEITGFIIRLLRDKNFPLKDISALDKIHDAIIDLDSVYGLIAFDTKLINDSYRSEYVNAMLRTDLNSTLAKMIIKKFSPFIKDGLNYQLRHKDRVRFDKNAFGDELLRESCDDIILGVIQSVANLESKFSIFGKLNTSIMKSVYSQLTSDQLGFIYARLASFDRNPMFSSDLCAREEIYGVLANRSINDRIEFIKTICALPYCIKVEGICATLMSGKDVFESEELYHKFFSLSVREDASELGIDSTFANKMIDISRNAKTMIDEDLYAGRQIDSIVNYIVCSSNNSGANAKKFMLD